MLTVAFDESTMSRTQFQLWYNRFKEGREDVNHDVGPFTSISDENIVAMKKMIRDNHPITTAEDVGILFGLCQTIFRDVLSMKRAAVV